MPATAGPARTCQRTARARSRLTDRETVAEAPLTVLSFAACRVRSADWTDALLAPEATPQVSAERPGAGRGEASCHLYGGGIVPPRHNYRIATACA